MAKKEKATKTIEVTRDQLDTIIISLDAACVLSRNNARETTMDHMRALYLENANKYKNEQNHWIEVRNELFGPIKL